MLRPFARVRLPWLAGSLLAGCMGGALAQTGGASALSLAPSPYAENGGLRQAQTAPKAAPPAGNWTPVSAPAAPAAQRTPQAAAVAASGPAASTPTPAPGTPAAAAETPPAEALPTEEEGGFAPATAGHSFDIRIESPNSDVRKLVDQHLELKRYQKVADLDQAELRQLLTRSETQIRQLLGTQGYFTPDIQQELLDHADQPGKLPEVLIAIDPGPPAKISKVDLQFNGAVRSYAPAREQLLDIYSQWELPVGETFTQTAWSSSKTMALRGLQARRFPTAKLVSSQAAIDPDSSSAELALDYDSGPVYRYGEVQIKGNQRYDPVIIQRLTRVQLGAEYSLDDMVQAQQRLLESGYYNGAFVSIDTTEGVNPQQAPVLVQVQEARLQRVVAGVGYGTDSGPRMSLDYTHNLDPIFGWRFLSKLELDKKRQSLGTSLTAPPDDGLWRWQVGGKVNREKLQDFTSNSEQLRVGRTKQERQIDRTWYFQYDHGVTKYNDGTRESAQALSANYIWTYRRFNSMTFPTSGYGFGVELGGGVTTQPVMRPFTRVVGRYLTFLSLDEPLRDSLRQALPQRQDLKAVATGQADQLTAQDSLLLAQTPAMVAKRRNGELMLRLDAGGVWSRADAVFPNNLLFLTGGDASVRGYAYQQLGARTVNGLVTPGRYMVAGSVEYRRPISSGGKPTDWDSVVYVDAGSVADTVGGLRPLKVGVGAGALWRSPVGPIQMSIARGIQARQFRLHLNLGFRF